MDRAQTPAQQSDNGQRPGREFLRTRPVQARSRETFDAILAASAALLSEVGWDAFNTNLLAERADCRVATVYRYFPDKLAVIATLAEMVVAQWGNELADFATVLDREGDMRLVWPQFLHRFVALLRDDPAALAVRKAMQIVPQLRSIDQADNQELAEALGRAIQAHLPDISERRANAAARTLIETAVTAIDHALMDPSPAASSLLAEIEAMHVAYIDQLYRDAGQSPR